MFGFLKRAAKKQLNFEQLQILQLVVQQVVLSIDGSIKLPGASKKAMALELVGQISEELNLMAPESLVDAMIESAVQILKSMSSLREKKPKFSFDISGRPGTGN